MHFPIHERFPGRPRKHRNDSVGVRQSVTIEPDVWLVLENCVRKSELINIAVRSYLLDGAKEGHADRYRRQMQILEGALTLPEPNPGYRTVRLRTHDPLSGELVLQHFLVPPGYNPNTGVTTFEIRHCPSNVLLLDVMELFDYVPQVERSRVIFSYKELCEFAVKSGYDERLQRKKQQQALSIAARMEASRRKTILAKRRKR